MSPNNSVIAYIDGANLYKGIESLKWDLDYARFRTWLSDKYKVNRAYIFIGYIPKYKTLYTQLQEAGFTLVFKDVVYDGRGKPKGNCDADLVVHAMQNSYEQKADQFILVSSDGDYTPLVLHWQKKKQLKTILSPAPSKKCSVLLKRTNAPIAYLDDQKNLLKIHP